MEDYYGNMGDKFFDSHFDWSTVNSLSDHSPRATFQLRGDFNHTSSTVAYNFIVDLTGLFGEFVEPMNLEKGCIALKLKFNQIADYLGRPFVSLIHDQDEYHNLFLAYGVTKIILTRFPPKWVTQHYRISVLGRPLLH